jgi:hypothetical protein
MSSKFFAASYKNPSNLLILQHTACIESFFVFAGALLFDKKKSALSAVFRACLAALQHKMHVPGGFCSNSLVQADTVKKMLLKEISLI